MKTAFAHLENRIAPVFDTARHILIVETESGRIIKELQELLPSDPPVQKVLRLTELGVSVLVCGAISKPFNDSIISYGIQVIPFVAGDLRQVIMAWLNNGLNKGNTFAMPGCCGSGRRRFRGGCGNKQ
ncbi:MAG: hypothetical protein A2268_14745 [Candidatus Raymondbacteria bacterium RifOxyA12_full_50_37]|uniref:Dinitrogenase iron-molybdenum cofactor biosynthesis domain-containing protein n=1 Tax=Candidatus Raymondbacteria bacterium RIFOXYD12_FULL_49_13 TaxID=1817890 RepID=A0A1F7F2G2_UNCRA|nr:MAG: hypothetical protein A2268_14745 [Candidatus Raymondbacteria bacterium RifOxyA12_full_50_37]OGJ87823.1 MAG: hypothetical protein A2350_12690 [Candidatus Raymondbacteria bacterium RifOxyB12_full_50_8]OGJ88677.1 MAG: hypothetical protein A2248_20680 [Candidatus Raymondbacteria bacterium RIFOXYA2_FULL_49_16]OGJ95967.1 MAG: hypothetical protein A2487_21055 [Candidatus Raymondbacteria bacterium RifOxyC12_full_50_8]OGK00849.1 MAG: hypothetical protein A2519_07935 [Candidatus Raymondbacteria b